MKDEPRDETVPALETRGISKAFGHVQALADVNFMAYAAEVMALVGDNGAGKSTLMKIVSGVYRPDSGEILIRGKPVAIHQPSDAAQAGVASVYQDLALVDTRDVAANIFLGREFTTLGGVFVDRARCLREARSALAQMRADVPSVKTNVGLLSGGQRQAVAICRALAQGGQIMFLDEPTASLGVAQAHQVLDLVRDLRAQGVAVIIISHNMEHVLSVADRITVMRQGRLVGVRRKAETSVEEIVQMIVGGSR